MLGQNISSPPKLTSKCLNTVQSHQFHLLMNPSERGEPELGDLTQHGTPLLWGFPPSLVMWFVAQGWNKVSWSWAELLRVWHHSVFLGQLIIWPNQFSLSLQMTPNRQKREGEGTDEPLFRETWTACTTRPTRIAGALAEMESCTHNATMPSSSSTGCSTAVLQLVHCNY